MPIIKNVYGAVDDDSKSLLSLDATDATHKRHFTVSASSVCAVQINLKGTAGTGSRSVWYVKVSLGRSCFVDFTTGAVTLSPGQMTPSIDVTIPMYIEVGIVTPSTYSTETVDILFGRGDWT